LTDVQILPPRIAAAAERYRQEKGVPVEQDAGTDDPMMVELFLIVAGYIDDEPTLVATTPEQP
jgi:hypothetical protein